MSKPKFKIGDNVILLDSNWILGHYYFGREGTPREWIIKDVVKFESCRDAHGDCERTGYWIVQSWLSDDKFFVCAKDICQKEVKLKLTTRKFRIYE